MKRVEKMILTSERSEEYGNVPAGAIGQDPRLETEGDEPIVILDRRPPRDTGSRR